MAATLLKLADDQGEKSSQLHACAELIASGGLAVVPMETVYGVLARLDQDSALTRLRALRGGDRKAMTLHLSSPEAALPYLDPPNSFAQRILRKLLPGPVSLVFSVSSERQTQAARDANVSRESLYEHNLITLRCPAHAHAREIIRLVKHPVAGAIPADPANRVDDFLDSAGDKVDMVIDDGPATFGKPSTMVKVNRDSFDILRPGVYDRRIIEKMLQTTILFVCSGNTCRSPMAEAIARKVLADYAKVPPHQLEKHGYRVLSAGASAMAGSPATAHAVTAAKNLGGDLSKHRSRLLTENLVQQADVIFAMGRSHLEVVKMFSPEAATKVQILDPEGEIEDPIGGEFALYQSLAEKMQHLIEQRLRDQSLLGLEKSK